MDIIKVLLSDGKFWAALFAILNAIVFYVAPDFPKEIWASIDALVALVIATLLAKGAPEKVRRVRGISP